ncbi:invasion associated locus B family protein [Xanthobacter sp. V4C-4]|uniref:invasion associated locus B family protein n=1 Tax=Xanthobacter cornucopiae TaxID=3119924 RepID=UPI003728BC32
MIIMSRKVFLPARAKAAVTALAWTLAAALGGGTALQGSVARAESPAASETRSTHDDWVVRCKKDASPKECEAVQTLQTPDLKGVLAHVAVRARQGGEVLLVVLTPPGVWLPANVTFKVGGVPDLTLSYKRCGQFCVASLALTPENLAALKASAGKGELTFETGSRNPVILPVSFKGLGEAIAASLKS